MKIPYTSTSFLMLILYSCSINKRLSYTNSDIIGRWALTKESINYPTLDFQKDSTVTLYSRGDTVYSYNYYLNKTELVLNYMNRTVYKDRILRLDKDSLIFETLAQNKSIQKYKRIK